MLDQLARPSGTFAMVALDQRDTLRTIVRERTGRTPGEAELRAFKVAAARLLSPASSAVLLDRELGLEPVLEAGALAPGCGLIVAADRLVQAPGGPVTATDLDDTLDAAGLAAAGAVALKLLVIWRNGAERGRVEDTVGRFVARCRGAGLVSLVEALARPPFAEAGGGPAPTTAATGPAGWDHEAACLDAAAALGALGPDVYKAEVPFLGRASGPAIEAAAARRTALLPCPWVVLSNGVALDDFPAAVDAACRGGASGFLAGRAIWSDSLVPPATPEGGPLDGVEERLGAVALPRLRALGATVDAVARPWSAACG